MPGLNKRLMQLQAITDIDEKAFLYVAKPNFSRRMRVDQFAQFTADLVGEEFQAHIDSTEDVHGAGSSLNEESPGVYTPRILQRDADGQIELGPPTEDAHASTKKYVDDEISSLGTAASVDTGTGTDEVPTNGDLPTFGTAASADVTTSPTDTTSGRLMGVGDGGLLGIAPLSEDSAEADSGFYRNGAATGFPGANGVRIVTHRAAGRALQIWSNASNADPTQELFFRVGDPSVVDWQELYHSGNYPSDDSWTTPPSLLNGWAGTVRYIKRAGMVTVTLDALDASARTSTIILTLPSDYRPTVAQAQASSEADVRFTVSAGGNLSMNASGTAVSGSITYPVI